MRPTPASLTLFELGLQARLRPNTGPPWHGDREVLGEVA